MGNNTTAGVRHPLDKRDYARTSAALGGQYRKFFGASIAAILLLQVTIVTDTIIVGQLLGAGKLDATRTRIFLY